MKTLGIVGGDLRSIRLAESLAEDENKIYVYGLEMYSFNDNIIKCSNLEECINKSEYLIGPMPLTKDGEVLNCSFSKEIIKLEKLFNDLKNKKFIAGSINDELAQLAQKNDNQIYDLLKDEYLTVLNVIPTVEGAIQIAMSQTEYTIHGSKILILGFGRIGKLLAKNLYSMGADVTCEARKQEDFAWIEVYGYKMLDLKDLTNNLEVNKYDIIFNTIPHIILDEERLSKISKKCLLIDLASKPGGIDFKIAEQLNIKANWALALPGKVAPQTAAKYIKESIYKIINKGEL